jgi:hypothetical protein
VLVLALIYLRYRPDAARARELLEGVIPRLHDSHEREMAQAELARLTSPPGGAPPSVQPA